MVWVLLSNKVIITAYTHDGLAELKVLCHPQNLKYITYRNAVRGGTSHGHKLRAQKLVKLGLVVSLPFSRYASHQTNKQTYLSQY